jgi:hypothetical protein
MLQQRYHLTKPLMAVQFAPDANPRIVMLPTRTELRVIGVSTSIPDCVEIETEHERCHIFEVDLLSNSVTILAVATAA